MVKVIYFDYHGVLDRRSFRGLLQTIAKSSGQPDPAKVAADMETYVFDYATGKIRPHEFWRTIEERFGTVANRAGRAYQLHVEPVLEMWNLLSTLHSRYELGLCTDCSTDKKEVLRSAYALTDYFDFLIFSCDVLHSKRDLAFYQLMLQNGKYSPEECLLIDDTEHNCSLAVSLGFQAHVYRDPETLQNYLQTL